jgi:hypothetical protein
MGVLGMIEVTDVAIVRCYVLDVSFSDGTRKYVDVSPLLWGPLFEPLKDPAYFAKGQFDPEIRTVAWPNEADIAPEYLYEHGSSVVAEELESRAF